MSGTVTVKCPHCGVEATHTVTVTRTIRDRERDKEGRRLHWRQYRKRPDVAAKISARSRFQYAVRSGKIKRQPCFDCGNPKAQGHHSDYSKPYEVIWLCRPCHDKRHSAG